MIYEIKSYLPETDLIIKGIPDRMNYDYVSYLCRFFHNATEQSMMVFWRKQR